MWTLSAPWAPRWKIENEGINVLKGQGYHVEHNFGHGKQYLSQVFLVLNLLAFLLHTALELVDDLYRFTVAHYTGGSPSSMT